MNMKWKIELFWLELKKVFEAFGREVLVDLFVLNSRVVIWVLFFGLFVVLLKGGNRILNLLIVINYIVNDVFKLIWRFRKGLE